MSETSRVKYSQEQRKKAIERNVPLVTIDIDARHLPATGNFPNCVGESVNPYGTRARGTMQGTLLSSEFISNAVNTLLLIAKSGGVKLNIQHDLCLFHSIEDGPEEKPIPEGEPSVPIKLDDEVILAHLRMMREEDAEYASFTIHELVEELDIKEERVKKALENLLKDKKVVHYPGDGEDRWEASGWKIGWKD
jgi:hypothetical protein